MKRNMLLTTDCIEQKSYGILTLPKVCTLEIFLYVGNDQRVYNALILTCKEWLKEKAEILRQCFVVVTIQNLWQLRRLPLLSLGLCSPDSRSFVSLQDVLHLQTMTNLRSLYSNCSINVSFGGLTQIDSLSFYQPRSIQWPPNLTNLEFSGSNLEKCDTLKKLTIKNTRGFMHDERRTCFCMSSDIITYPNLEILDVENHDCHNFQRIVLPKLHTLYCSSFDVANPVLLNMSTKNFSNLLMLQIANVTSFVPFTFITSLTHLVCYNVQTGHLKGLSALQSLTHLNLAKSSITNYSDILHLKKLDVLILKHAKQVVDLAQLQNHPSLSVLDLRGCLVKNMQSIATLSCLTDVLVKSYIGCIQIEFDVINSISGSKKWLKEKLPPRARKPQRGDF